MKIVSTFLFILFAQRLAVAQAFKAPDYNVIQKEISDQASPYYYSALRARYDRRDSTLTFEGFRHLYFGFFFQSDFALRGPEQEELDGYNRREHLTDQECRRIIELTSGSLKVYPFDLRRMSLLIYAYQQLNDESSAKREIKIYSSIIDVIFSSGDGKACETGYHVTSISDEYVIMAVSKLQVTSQSLIDHCDYLEAADNERKIPGIYFDITKVLEKESEALGDFGELEKELKKSKKKKKNNE